MGKGRVPGARALVRGVFCLLVVVALLSPSRQARGEEASASMQAYCSVPPLPGLGIKPNLLLLIDNSASMYDLAYTDPGTFCVDNTFYPSRSYPGYFEESTFYSYLAASDSFAAASVTGTGGSACNHVRTEQLCLNVTSGSVDNFLATGKFLNWLATSKLDLEKLALTGGRYDPSGKLLQPESRGCQGRRFVKTVHNVHLDSDGKEQLGEVLPVTFAVRGPIPSESGYVSQGNHGGPTRIEIYPANYNKEACLGAISTWQNRRGVASLTSAVVQCMGARLTETDGITPTSAKVYSETLGYCYDYQSGIDILYSTISNTLLKDCYRRYKAFYEENPAFILRNTGDDVCAQGLFHNFMPHSSGATSIGYLGQCYIGPNFRPQCSVDQTKDFCADIEKPWLSDPSTSVSQTGTNASLPGFILDAGITGLGKPGLTAQARIAVAEPPSGLIQTFSADINFGAMVFNDDGAGSECGGTIPCLSHCKDGNPPFMHKECYVATDCNKNGLVACEADPRSDGGRIISYINSSPVGDHGSGLIAAIDGIRATSWTPLAESFYEAIGYFANLAPLRLQTADFDAGLPPSKYSCQRNSVVILSDGASSADRAPAMNSFVAAAVGAWVNSTDGMPASRTTANGSAATSPPENQGSYNLDDLAWVARNKNIFDPSTPITKPNQYLTTHVVYTGSPCGEYLADGSCVTTDEGVPEKMMQLTAAKGGGSITPVKDAAGVRNALKGVFMQVRGGSNAGSGSSMLATGEGNGALFVQPQFYPDKSFDNGGSFATWIGELQSLWYYIDPFINGSSGGASGIREDTGGGRTLDLKQDRVVQFVVDPSLQEARAKLSVDADGDGSIDTPQPEGYPRIKVPEAVQSLWRAGRKLWRRSPGTRTLYTQTGGTSLVPFLDTSVAAHRELLLARDQKEADQIVAFVKGVDDSSGTSGAPTRDRTVAAYGTTEKDVWKLGDIISSGPVLQSGVPLGSYHLPPPAGYGDTSYSAFIRTSYPGRGTVYVGANDGMLHAFRLGRLKVRPEPSDNWPVTTKAELTTTSGDEDKLGEEQWAFVPNGALPYLKYLKEPLYPHLYYVDGTSTLVDASIGDPGRCSRDDYWNCARDMAAGSNWRTILIGGMGLGGASRPFGAPCADQEGSATCVKAPAGGGGLSSYFALDVTGQTGDGTGSGPGFLWEFSHPQLGFSTSGAAILRVKARSVDGFNNVIHDPNKNGRWFAVFASGPTGAVDRGSRQFTAVSDQNLKLFVVDLNAVPPLTQGRNYWVIDTGITNAFGGSMAGAGIDADRWNGSSEARGMGNYEDDALYVGYTRGSAGGGWSGGVLRLFTNQDPDPSTWKTSIVIDGTGPVTGAVGKLQDRQYKRLWLYFGAGRYFHNQDDLAAGRALYGVSEPCYGTGDSLADGNCSKTPVRVSELTDVTDIARVVQPKDQGDGYKGWRITLDAASGALGSERAIDSPSSLTGGAVFFPTFKPSLEPCLDGLSYLWGVHYSTGGVPRSLSAQALLPLSNGSMASLDTGGFTDRDNRRSPPQPGKGMKPRLVTNSGLKPLKKIIHIQER
ncbi:pilus assembly protein PilY [Geomonas subterranea]|uniref:Pilus assembly protein PilY n=1 Tax=Geomonas subterranea TaxID=2847989 RepID=A0ABX8LK43_9BACT|nr:pilus assembly protein PilY [Geomonas subterranea]QXE91197.1 pilus assembly protein PilY [Geomonas subterranea]QXM10716.1 pilus assembly protein PilY [Geomonas subterranea]